MAKDPSRTLTLRLKFITDMNKRFRKVQRAIRQLVVEDDVFGLADREPLSFNVEKRAWAFRTDAQKQAAFRRWLQTQVNENIITDVDGSKPWVSEYITTSYKKGLARSYREVYDVSGDLMATDVDRIGKGGLFGSSFLGPEKMERVEAIYMRAWSDLEGVTDAMQQKLSRTLALGLAQGINPRELARQLSKGAGQLNRTRARAIARTEIIAAHAEAQLDGYQDLNVREVTIQAEWLTAGRGVCPVCAAMEGTRMTIQEARGYIPAHPNCRCAWTSVVSKKGKKPTRPARKPSPDLLKPKGTGPRGPKI